MLVDEHFYYIISAYTLTFFILGWFLISKISKYKKSKNFLEKNNEAQA